jgi:hypothetical protein
MTLRLPTQKVLQNISIGKFLNIKYFHITEKIYSKISFYSQSPKIF